MTAIRNELWQLPPVILPHGERRDFWIAAGRFAVAPVGTAERLPGRFALPGLVDAHCHLAVTPAMQATDLAGIERALAANRREDPSALDRPSAVVLNGVRVR